MPKKNAPQPDMLTAAEMDMRKNAPTNAQTKENAKQQPRGHTRQSTRTKKTCTECLEQVANQLNAKRHRFTQKRCRKWAKRKERERGKKNTPKLSRKAHKKDSTHRANILPLS